MNITDEMVKAFVDSYEEGCCNDSSADWCCTRHALAFVAPLIAAQALREARQSFVIAEHAPVHACPEGAAAVTPCCGRNPLELLGHRMAVEPALVTCPGRERSQPADEAKRSCPRCGSPEWVSVSLDQGCTRRAQCVPCGHYHPGVIGPGWRSS